MRPGPLSPPASWYQRYWFNERSPIDALIDRLLLTAIVALTLLAGGTMLVRHNDGSRHITTATDSQTGR